MKLYEVRTGGKPGVRGKRQTGSYLQMSRNLFSGGVHRKAGPFERQMKRRGDGEIGRIKHS